MPPRAVNKGSFCVKGVQEERKTDTKGEGNAFHVFHSYCCFHWSEPTAWDAQSGSAHPSCTAFVLRIHHHPNKKQNWGHIVWPDFCHMGQNWTKSRLQCQWFVTCLDYTRVLCYSCTPSDITPFLNTHTFTHAQQCADCFGFKVLACSGGDIRFPT